MKLFLTRLCDKQAIKIYISALVLQIANMIRFMIDSYSKPLPAILEIPSKDHPYDPSQDSILSQVKHMFSSDPSGSSDRN
jgi:ATP synthase F subunit